MKVAAVQMTSDPHVAHNLKQAARWIATAADQGAQLIVLPEMFAILGATDTELLSHQERFGQGPLQNFLSEQALTHKIWLVGGTIPLRADAPDKVRAACLVYSPDGLCLHRYDKIHLYDATLSSTESYRESNVYEAGEHPCVATTPLGNLGLGICYDLRFPELFRELSTQQAEIFCIPAAFTVKTGRAHWELLIRARAVENFCFVIGAAQGGQHTPSRRTWGHSLIINPWGEVIAAKLDDSPGILLADLDMAEIAQVRHMLPALSHRRIR